MKDSWNVEELKDCYSFSPEELRVVLSKYEDTRIGFAVLFLFFKNENRFPKEKNEIPQVIVDYIAEQIDLPKELFLDYDWLGITIKRHREEIRRLFGFKEVNLKDLEELKNWLLKDIVPENNDYEYARENPLWATILSLFFNKGISIDESCSTQKIVKFIPQRIITKMAIIACRLFIVTPITP